LVNCRRVKSILVKYLYARQALTRRMPAKVCKILVFQE
jgi:hypothetical protein